MGACALFRGGELRPHLTQRRLARKPRPSRRCVAWAEVYLRTKWHLDPSSRLATIDMGQKLDRGVVPFFLWELGPHRTQSHLGRGLPPYQVAS